jgi:hypothetical protein
MDTLIDNVNKSNNNPPTYTPQSGQVPSPESEIPETAEKFVSKIDFNNISPLFGSFKQCCGSAFYRYLAFLATGDWRAVVTLVVLLFVIVKLIYSFLCNISYLLGCLTGFYVAGQQRTFSKMYRPQSGNNTEDQENTMVVICRNAFDLVMQVRQGFKSLDEVPPYCPQSNMEDSSMPQEASPSEEPGALTAEQSAHLRDSVARITDQQWREAVVNLTRIDIANWQKDPKTYPLPKDILNRGVAFSPVMQATLHDALLAKPVFKADFGFGKGI